MKLKGTKNHTETDENIAKQPWKNIPQQIYVSYNLYTSLNKAVKKQTSKHLTVKGNNAVLKIFGNHQQNVIKLNKQKKIISKTK